LTSSIADTSFLVDWVRYSGRDLLFKYYNIVYLTESVLDEIRSEATLQWIASWMVEGRVKVLEETLDVRREALRIVEASRVLPVRSADYPEAVCLVMGRLYNLHVLSENTAIFAVKELIPEYSGVVVLRAIDVLYNLASRGFISDFVEELRRYIRETRHTYSRAILRRYGLEQIE